MDPEDLNKISEGIIHAIYSIANSITPRAAAAGHDATGGTVDSLTEAVMGVTAGLVQVAESISELAAAVRYHE